MLILSRYSPGILLLLLSGCDGCRDDECPEGMPPGLELSGPLFSVDTTTPSFSFPVPGSDYELLGLLSDDQGRRQLAITGDGSDHEVSGPGWNLPPSAAESADGSLLICWNNLPGEASSITRNLPDPTEGVDLFCAPFDGVAVGAAVKAPVTGRAAWLRGVEAEDNGTYTVRYFQDCGWLIADPEATHGTWEVGFSAAGFGSPHQVSDSFVGDGSGDGSGNDTGDTGGQQAVWYHDGDGDGYGDPYSAFSSEDAPEGYVADGTDCNDEDASIHPQGTELWGTGVDEDCDGVVDEQDAVEGTYSGTFSASFQASGCGTCAWYGGTTVTCSGTASSEVYAAGDSLMLSGTVTCVADGTGSCGEGSTVRGSFTGQSCGGSGTGICGTLTFEGGACTDTSCGGASSMPGYGDLVGTLDGNTFDLSFTNIGSCAAGLSTASGTVSLNR